MTARIPGITCLPVTGIGEVRPGDDLAALLGRAAALSDGDVLVVTSKVVSKAEGRVTTMERSAALQQETDRVVATRGGTSIVRTHHGLVMAGAGIDASNTEPGTFVLLPVDPDASARALRERIAGDGGPNVAVLVTDTSGRAWRNGQTDIAVGAAGLDVLHDYAGRTDGYGNLLAVTAPAVADEIAGAADLVKGKLGRCPAAVVRGLERLVLGRGEHGPGAAALVRDEAGDMFGHGAREAVLNAVLGEGRRGFGAPATAETLADWFRRVDRTPVVDVVSENRVEIALPDGDDPAAQRGAGNLEARLVSLAFALGWERSAPQPRPAEVTATLRFRPATP